MAAEASPSAMEEGEPSVGRADEAESGGGSARTDLQRNLLLSSRARQRRHILKQKAATSSGSGLDLISIQGEST